MDVFTLETKLFPCLVDMRFKGVRVDLEHADKLKKNLMQREAKIVSRIKELTGIEVEIHAARSIAKAFDKLKLPYDRTEKSNVRRGHMLALYGRLAPAPGRRAGEGRAAQEAQRRHHRRAPTSRRGAARPRSAARGRAGLST